MLRIIAGDLRRRQIDTPRGNERTRPLPDRVRTSVFNMLAGHFEDEVYFDAFAGTGSFGFEAISRGARECVFVEKDRGVMRLLKGNAEKLGIEDRCTFFHGDALGAGAAAMCPEGVHVIFFDPPYPLMQDPQTRARVFEQFERVCERLDPEGFALLRTPWPLRDRDEDSDPEHPTFTEVALGFASLVGPETHTYGTTAVHWFGRVPSSASADEAPGDDAAGA
ncbi:MAG: RsmD family RNA methyltransferase [Planctomycetota bacterium]